MARCGKRVVTFFAPLEDDNWALVATEGERTLSIFRSEVDSDIRNIIETFAGESRGGRWRIHKNDFEYLSSLLSTVGASAQIECIPSADLISMVVMSYSMVDIQEVL